MRLTGKFGNRYFAQASVDEIVRKLHKIESEAPLLLASICDKYCMFPQVLDNQDALTEKCEGCPMNKLTEMIE